jgi:hypothetical protein
MKQAFAEFSVYKLAKVSQCFLRLGQKVFVTEQLVAAMMLKPPMQSRRPPIPGYSEPNAEFPDQPAKSWVR